jgi:ribonuclease Z
MNKIFVALLTIVVLYSPVRAEEELKVRLLGTGSPPPVMNRFGPSILVEAGKEELLFDCGRGCLQRLEQLKIATKEVNNLFLTHLHSDHVGDSRLLANGMA